MCVGLLFALLTSTAPPLSRHLLVWVLFLFITIIFSCCSTVQG
ncbi:Uncharacterized protein APZ42_015579 [Daphnia magna]|uniref:Uncharacterized protein n=1 Tax=Daphnia magna TaxID=35525 RepID=A0A162NV67_9CRUS|nr:Uncharacterized protein APZ42_015579 [Daphnia magna]